MILCRMLKESSEYKALSKSNMFNSYLLYKSAAVTALDKISKTYVIRKLIKEDNLTKNFKPIINEPTYIDNEKQLLSFLDKRLTYHKMSSSLDLITYSNCFDDEGVAKLDKCQELFSKLENLSYFNNDEKNIIKEERRRWKSHFKSF